MLIRVKSENLKVYSSFFTSQWQKQGVAYCDPVNMILIKTMNMLLVWWAILIFYWYRKQKVIYNVIWFRLIALRIYPTIDWSRNIWYIYYFKVNPLLVKFNPLRRLYNIIYLQFFTNKNWCYIHFIERSLTKINSICLVLLCFLVYFIWWVFCVLYFK